MSDDQDQFERELAAYLVQLDRFQRTGKWVGAANPPRPPRPPERRHPPRTFAGFPSVAHGMTREEIWKGYDELKPKLDRRPTRLAVAGVLGVSESTVERAQKELGIRRWPPPRRPPEI